MPDDMTQANPTNAAALSKAGLDHMGRRHAATMGEAFRQDWPWIVALAALVFFVMGGLSGDFRL